MAERLFLTASRITDILQNKAKESDFPIFPTGVSLELRKTDRIDGVTPGYRQYVIRGHQHSYAVGISIGAENWDLRQQVVITRIDRGSTTKGGPKAEIKFIRGSEPELTLTGEDAFLQQIADSLNNPPSSPTSPV